MSKAANKETSGQDGYIRGLYKSAHFPKVDANGAVYITKPGTTGRASIKSRKDKFDDDSLNGVTAHLRQHFPQGALHTVSSPEYRALAHKPTGVQSTLHAMFRVTTAAATVPAWTDEKMALAAKEFEVPDGTQILLFLPEIFERKILLQDPKFCFQYTDLEGKTRTGVKTPCPWCKSNKDVTLKDKTGYKEGQHRTIADFRAKIPIYCFIASCNSTTCIGDPATAKGDSTDNVTAHSFHCYEPHVFANYPEALRRKYQKNLFTAAKDGQNGSMFVTEELCSEILKDETNFAALTRHMNDAYERRLRHAIDAYVQFIQQQSPNNSASWPDFNHANFEKLFKPPSATTIKVIFVSAFQLVFPFLRRDMFARVPGSSVKMDGTFQFLSKTSNDEYSETENKCLHIVWGEYGHILAWAFDGSENDLCFQRLNYFLRKRCDMIGPEHAKAVRAAFSDTCCQGLHDVTLHWVTWIWEYCYRAPYRDLFHCSKRLTDATHPLHELGNLFCRLVSQAFLQFDEASARYVAGHYLDKTKLKMAPEIATERVKMLPVFRKKIKNVAPKRTVMAAALREAYSRTELADQQKRAEAALKGDDYMPLLLSEKKGVRLGTAIELKNILKHVDKGCCEDPFELDEVNVALQPEAPYPDYIRMRGTSQGESSNRLINKLTNHIGRQTAVTADMRFWLMASNYNLNKDWKLREVLGLKQERTMEWYLHEAMLKQHQKLSAYNKIVFPPELPDDYDEPLGIEYGRYKKWSEIDAEFTRLINLSGSNNPPTGAVGPPMDGGQEEDPMVEDDDVEMPALLGAVAAASTAVADVSPAMVGGGTDSSVVIVAAATSTATSAATPVTIPATTTTTVAAMVPMAAMPAQVQQQQQKQYGPQSRWSRSLNAMTAYNATVGNTYLPENKALNGFQLQHFWKSYTGAREYEGDGANEEVLVARTVKIWNNTHFFLIQSKEMPCGLDGMIRPGQVKAILRKKAFQLRAAHVGGNNPHLKPAAMTKKTLKRQEIPKLSHRDCAPWLRKIGKPLSSYIAERKQALMQHFEGKPADYELSL